MNKYTIGDREWCDLNDTVKMCGICCGTSYIVKKNSIVELVVWAGGNDKPLWFAVEYFRNDAEKYYEKERYALLKKNTLFEDCYEKNNFE